MESDILNKFREMVRLFISNPEDHPMFLLLVAASLQDGVRMYAAGAAWKKSASILMERELVDLDSFGLVDVTPRGREVANQFVQFLEMPFDKNGRWKD